MREIFQKAQICSYSSPHWFGLVQLKQFLALLLIRFLILLIQALCHAQVGSRSRDYLTYSNLLLILPHIIKDSLPMKNQPFEYNLHPNCLLLEPEQLQFLLLSPFHFHSLEFKIFTQFLVA